MKHRWFEHSRIRSAAMAVAVLALVTAVGARADWETECAHALESLQLTPESMVEDHEGRLHLFYGGDYLRHAWLDDTGWHFEIVDPEPGRGPALAAVDPWGDLVLVYHCQDYLPQNLPMRTARSSAAGWQITEIPDSQTLSAASLALDSQGWIHLAVWDHQVRVVEYLRETADGWELEVVDLTVDTMMPSLALDDTDRPHMAYYYWPPSDLRYAVRRDDGWQITLLDSAGAVGSYSALEIDPDNTIHIVYNDLSTPALKYAVNTGADWQFEVIDAANASTNGLSLRLDSSGRPHLAYSATIESFPYVIDLMYAWRDPESGWCADTIEATAQMSSGPALAIREGDRPWMAYGRFGRDDYHLDTPSWLKLAARDEAGWSVSVLREGGILSGPAVLALDSLDRPHVLDRDWLRQEIQLLRRGDSGWELIPVPEAEYLSGCGLALDVSDEDVPQIGFGVIGVPGTRRSLMRALWTGWGWTEEIVDPSECSAIGLSLQLDGQGYAHFLHLYFPDCLDTAYLTYTFEDGSGWHQEVVDGGWFDEWATPTHLCLDSAGRPHGVFPMNDGLGYGFRDQSGWHTEPVPGGSGHDSALALTDEDVPVVAYLGQDAAVVCAFREETGWRLEEVDVGFESWCLAMASDPTGKLHLAYVDPQTGGQRHAVREPEGWVIEDVPSSRRSGNEIWLAVGADGTPWISIIDSLSYDLFVSHRALDPTPTPSPTPTTTPPPPSPTSSPPPTSSPSPTATPTEAPSALPSATPVPEPSLELELNAELYRAGDRLLLLARAANPGGASLSACIVVLLDLGGSYFAWPSWLPVELCEAEDLGLPVTLSGQSQVSLSVLEFTWPEAPSIGDVCFLGALLDLERTRLIGQPDLDGNCFDFTSSNDP